MKGLKISKRFTPRDKKSLDRYLNDIGKKPMILPQEEIELARKIKQGDKDALNKLVEANLRFVVSIAKQYLNINPNLGDLINQGNEGIIKAAKRFDETRGFKFISYAVWWIRQSILQYLAEEARLVRVPLSRSLTGKNAEEARAIMEQELCRPIELDELADKLGVSVENLKIARAAYLNRHLSLDEQIDENDEGDSSLDRLESWELPPDNNLNIESLTADINASLLHLSDRDRDIIIYYYGLNNEKSMTLEDISKKMNLTTEGVRQIQKKALRQLRKLNGPKLKSYLG